MKIGANAGCEWNAKMRRANIQKGADMECARETVLKKSSLLLLLLTGHLAACGGGGGGGGGSGSGVSQPTPPVTLSLSTSNGVVTVGQPLKLSWTSTALTCTAQGDWSGAQ